MQKPRFFHGFSMISRVRRESKSLKILKKWSPECFGTPKNRQGWAELAGSAAQVANVGSMGAQFGTPPGLGLQKGDSEPQSAERAGATYARLSVFI